MKETPYLLDGERRGIVLAAIKEKCEQQSWELLAVHVRSNHVHIVVSARAQVEKILQMIKTHASQCLKKAGCDVTKIRRWTRHGSTRYLWTASSIVNTVHYVILEQGKAMSVFENKEAVNVYRKDFQSRG